MPSALATDLYEITMAAGYHAHGVDGLATFELYVRELPPTRTFLVAAGLDQALAYLERLRFTADEIAFLRQLPNMRGVDPAFFDDYLPAFRFSGEVWAIPEGTPVFPPAPLLRITAPLPEAQLAETALLSILMFQTGVASKAARVVLAGRGREIIEFGSRRAHGIDAAAFAARAAFIGGCAATSNVEAGLRFGVPLSGTMAHSWVTGFASERDAFELALVRAALKRDGFPLLGICRGMQILNVALGGDLVPHLPEQYGDAVPHRTPDVKPVVHDVQIEASSLLGDVHGTTRLRVHSIHHQAIGRVGDGLHAVAWSDDGVVEAIESRAALLMGVQWHPELDVTGHPARRVFDQLVAYARDYGGAVRQPARAVQATAALRRASP